MTTFSNSSSNSNNTTSSDFSFRTMQDDLLNLKKNNQESSPAPAPAAALAFEELSSPTPASEEKPKAIAENAENKENILPQKNPFIAKSFAANITEIPVPAELSTQTRSSKFPFSFYIVILLFIGVIGTGGYYFWTTTQTPSQPIVTEPLVETEIPTKESPVTIATSTGKYSSDKPNYLTIDLNTLNAAEIKNLLSKLATELGESSPKSLFEFIVVDNNNNPVAFPIFATATNFKLSPTILSNLNNDFSLFVYNDNNNMQFALNTTLNDDTNTDEFLSILSEQEKTFASDASFLFLDPLPNTHQEAFKSSFYKNYSIRYLNLDTNKNLSIDYTFNKKQFTLGTSKEALRTVLDSVSK